MLEVRDLAVSYGRHRALEGVSVAIHKGEICVILGANGAGKSTLLKAIAGTVRPEPGGEIAINGHSLLRHKPNRVVEEGIALVPEGRGIFGDLSVAENLQLGAHARRARRDASRTLATVYDLFPRLAERRRQAVRSMSGGEQQMVAIGRALMSRPEILMLDEPSLGLSPILTRDLFRSLAEIAGTGVGILLVEQNARASLKIAARGYLVENGHVTGEGSASALLHDPAVVSAYLGGAAVPAVRRMPLPPAFPLPADTGHLGTALAARASLIRAAYTRAERQAAALPSAFVGRYDPKAGGDPWADIAARAEAAQRLPPRAPQAARDLAATAPNLAVRAAARHATHITTARLSAPVPSAFRPAPAPSPRPLAADDPGAPSLIGHNSAGRQIDSAELAAHAAAIHAAHVADRRKRLTAFVVRPRLHPTKEN